MKHSDETLLLLDKASDCLEKLDECVQCRDEFYEYLSDGNEGCKQLFQYCITNRNAQIPVSAFESLSDFFMAISVYDTYVGCMNACVTLHDKYAAKMSEYIQFIRDSNFYTRIFASRQLNEAIYGLKRFVNSDDYDLIFKYYDVLNADVSFDSKDALSFYMDNFDGFVRTVKKCYTCFDTSALLYDICHRVDEILSNLQYDYESRKQLEWDAYTKDVENIIKSGYSKDGYRKLERLPVDELNRDKSRLPVKALRDNGFPTVADVWRSSPVELSNVRGVSMDSALRALAKAQEILDSLEPEPVSLKLSYDNRTSRSTAVLKKVYCLIRYWGAQEKLHDTAELISEQDLSALKACRSLIHRCGKDVSWLLFSDEERSAFLKACEKVFAYEHDATYASYVKFLSFEKRYRLANYQDISDDVVWDDFGKRHNTYIRCLEKLSPGVFESSDKYYGLPEELAKAVEAEVIYPNGLSVELRRYQLWGVKYALHQGRVLLGDEMGLGKTVQAIATMVSLRNVGFRHFIVICPASVLLNWFREVKRFSKLHAYQAHGPKRNDIVTDWMYHGGVLLTTYDTYLNLFIDDVSNVGLVVVDEAHYIKNPEAKRSIAVRSLCKNVRRVMFLTGTPIENHVDEMISLIGVLNRDVAQEARRNASIVTSKRFRDIVAPTYFRRKQSDVNRELPEKEESIVWCTLRREERRVYNEVVMTSSRPFMPMRRVSWNVDDVRLSSKGQALVDIVEAAEREGRKVIVFSYFKDTLAKVKTLLGSRCSAVLSGSVTAQNRQAIVDEFSRNRRCSVLVAQIVAGGVGLNIQAASVVVFCEPQIKPSMEDQAVGRVHRIGQSRNVLVYRLCCENTIDERILSLLDNKRAQFKAFADKSVSGEESLRLDAGDQEQIVKAEIERIKREQSGVASGDMVMNSDEGKLYRESQMQMIRDARAAMNNEGRERTVTNAQRQRILRRDNFTCQLCGRYGPGAVDARGARLPVPQGGYVMLEVDHKKPFSLGGSDDDDNLWTLCHECNSGKSNHYDDSNRV